MGCHFLLQCMKVNSEREVAQSSPTLQDPMDCSLPGSSVHGIFQARYWSGVLSPSPLTLADIITTSAKSLQLCPTLCDPVDSSPPGSSVHGILQARILEWVAMPSSKGSSQPRDQICISYVKLHWQAGSLPLAPPGKLWKGSSTSPKLSIDSLGSLLRFLYPFFLCLHKWKN